MSLSAREQEWWHLLVNDHQHEEPGEAEYSRDGRVSTRESKAGVGGRVPRGCVPIFGRTAGEPAVSEAKEEGARDRAALWSQDHRIEPGASDATNRPLEEASAYRKASGAAAPLCAALHHRRRGAAGRDRYGARGSVRAGDPPHPASRVRRL